MLSQGQLFFTPDSVQERQLTQLQDWTLSTMSGLMMCDVNFINQAEQTRIDILNYLAFTEVPYKSTAMFIKNLLLLSTIDDDKKFAVLSHIMLIKNHNLRVEILWGCLSKQTCLGAFFISEPQTLNQLKESSPIRKAIVTQLTLGILKLNKLDLGEAVLSIINKNSHLGKLVKHILIQLVTKAKQKYPPRPAIAINQLWLPARQDKGEVVSCDNEGSTYHKFT